MVRAKSKSKSRSKSKPKPKPKSKKPVTRPKLKRKASKPKPKRKPKRKATKPKLKTAKPKPRATKPELKTAKPKPKVAQPKAAKPKPTPTSPSTTKPTPRLASPSAAMPHVATVAPPIVDTIDTAIPPPTFHVPVGPARRRLRDALAWVEDFPGELRRLATVEGPLPWEHAEGLELVGLERWGTQLARTDREAAVCALVLAAQYGFPRILEAGGSVLDDMGYRGDEVLDGASVESLLDRAACWVDDPSEPNRQRVQDGFDPTRQLHVWEPDLRPTDASSYHWYYEVGQCAAAAIVKSDGDPDTTSYYSWPGAVSCGRGLVVAARGLRGPGADIEAIVRELYTTMTT